ncbi:hypothetical protein [Paenibacillus cineris]|uniref:hypothetical protein n=1 Tax=Paenibacillus cineris TaxID=237530 RepID=UPI001B017F35|nr:hypothetical protein J43TS9_31620 [Paenibacillus cineris]
MCIRFENNKEKFIALVFEMEIFSEKQITTEFYTANKDIIIDEHASIKDVLENLKEIGSLQYDGINYKVVSDHNRLAFNPFSFHVLA